MEKEIIKQKIKEIVDSIFVDFDSLVDINRKLNQDISSKHQTIDTLNNKITDLQSVVSSLELAKKEFDNLKLESAKLDKFNSLLLAELKELESKIESKQVEMLELVNSGKSEYEDFLKKTSDEKDFLVQERLRLDKEKDRLEKKDGELKIIENRFVRLFEGKNSAFKISS